MQASVHLHINIQDIIFYAYTIQTLQTIKKAKLNLTKTKVIDLARYFFRIRHQLSLLSPNDASIP